jgi:hypothetical protein
LGFSCAAAAAALKDVGLVFVSLLLLLLLLTGLA